MRTFAPERCANELDRREIVDDAFVISGSDNPELLDPIDKTLDEVMRAVGFLRKAEALLTAGAKSTSPPQHMRSTARCDRQCQKA